jgi:hypothetical protein
MSNDSLFHGDCRGSLSIWAGEIHCVNCGHIPLDVRPEIDSTEIAAFLPNLIEAGIIASTDFHGMALKQF